MRKAFLLILGLTVAGSMSHACIEGGNLFQLMASNGDVIANYDIKTGKLEASSRSYSVKNAYFVTVKNNEVLLGKSLCNGTGACEDLTVSGFSAPKTVLFIYDKFGESRSSAVIAQNLLLGKKAPIARSFPSLEPVPQPDSGEVDNLRVLDCSTKAK